MIILSMAMAAAFIAGAFRVWKQLDETDKNASANHGFRNWMIKGAALPMVLWIFINAGLFSKLPPLLPRAALRQPGWPRFFAMLDVASIGFLVIGSYWGMVTFGWLLARISHRIQERRDFYFFCLSCTLLLLPIAGFMLAYFGWGFAGFAGALWLAPMVYGTIEMVAVRKVRPAYSRAIAAMQFDRFDDAEAAVIQELEKCEEDFNGWMMLAELYATRFNDLQGAERTVRETCNQPNVDASQVSVAFHRLADWHLARGNDPVAASRALQEICRRFPDSHLERMARLRINQLPSNRDELIEQRKPKTFRLPALRNNLNEPADEQKPDAAGGDTAKAKANRYVERLQKNPDDVSAREELAVIFVQHLHQTELGIEQLQLLLEMPGQAEKKMAEWLGLIAAWKLRYLNDEPAARRILERLIGDYPQSPQAFAAQKRLSLMDEAAKIRQAQMKLSGSK